LNYPFLIPVNFNKRYRQQSVKCLRTCAHISTIYLEVPLQCHNFTHMRASYDGEIVRRILKLWHTYRLINTVFLQELVCLGSLIFISYHTTFLSKLWNITLNTQVIVPGIHRVLPCSFLWLNIQHICERPYSCTVYIFFQINITGIRTPTFMSPDSSSGFTHHRSIGTYTVSLDVISTRCLDTNLEF